jgi:hypothetical protein
VWYFFAFHFISTIVQVNIDYQTFWQDERLASYNELASEQVGV